ncbi:hypothetical protein IE53DRAFT_226421 [Violaceomyces palustris]|uniref:Uncharacterized protein n=1 Tax=Violaceomyces palustris TaxID=1673888 RepID=A0ACD0P4M4_9BASI|nr:hypothetical protein IE53DRAFT_226421 [Violaceomyces palustris]
MADNQPPAEATMPDPQEAERKSKDGDQPDQQRQQQQQQQSTPHSQALSAAPTTSPPAVTLPTTPISTSFTFGQFSTPPRPLFGQLAAASPVAPPQSQQLPPQVRPEPLQATPQSQPASIVPVTAQDAKNDARSLDLPASIPIDELSLAIVSATEPPVFTTLSKDRIVSPDNDLILYLYSCVLQLPKLRRTLSKLELEKSERDAKEAVIQSSLKSLREKLAESEKQVEEQRSACLELKRERDSLSSEAASIQTQLAEALTHLENERREKDELRDQKLKIESELITLNSQSASLKHDVEVERRAKELITSEKDRLSAELTGVSAQLSTLRSSSESGIRHAADMRGKINQVEQEKRDILASLQREREESTRKALEIDTLLKRSREARQEISKLTSEVQETRSQANTAKFKVQGLEQELELTRKDASWAHAELSKASEAAAVFRSAKRAETVSLQAEVETFRQEAASAKSKLGSLQKAFDETTARLNQSTSKVAELQTRLATQEDSFRSEVGTQSRLVQLLKKRAQDAQSRVDELESQWEAVLEQCRVREEAARAETEDERSMREELERQKEELAEALDRLAEGVGIGSNAFGLSDDRSGYVDDDDLELDRDEQEVRSRSSTPRRSHSATGRNGPRLSSLGLGMSPTAAFASRIQKSGKTFSQVYTELARTQEELRRERLETSRLGGVLAQVMDELQDRAPQLQAQREETSRLAQELDDLSRQLALTSEERDSSTSEAKGLRLELDRVSRENSLMSQQLADFGRQVRALTKEIIIRDDPTAADRLEDDGTLLAELEAAIPIPEDGSSDSDTQSVITTQLVTFRSLSELCAQNARLIQVTRQLGAKMEDEERIHKAKLAEEESEVVGQAKEVILRLQEEIKSERYKCEELTRERDMFRHLCASGAKGFGTGDPEEAKKDEIQQTAAAANVGYASSNEYEALRQRYDALRDELATDTQRLKEEVHAARNEVGAANVQAAREKAAREAVEQRYQTLQQSYELQASELAELGRRAQQLHESVTSKEIASHSMEEQVIEAKSTAERLRSQVANLQAEKDLWKSTEAKLVEENRSMLIERGNLNELVRNTQAMQAELESRGNQVRSRLEQEVKRLEEANADLQEKLSSEMEMYRQLSLRRELESKDLHTRIDNAGNELSRAREALAVARTSAEHTQLRMDDLFKQLEAAKHKLAVFERREASSRDPASAQREPEVQFSREEQLEIELADLKSGRAAAEFGARQARAEVERARDALRVKEEELEAVNKTYADFQAASLANLTQKDAEIERLQEQVSSLTSEISAAQERIKTAESQIEKQQKEFAQEKRSLEDAIAELGSIEERAKAEQEDVRGQVRKFSSIAKEAQTKLEAEVKSKREVVQELNETKEHYSRSRAEVVELRSAKELADAEQVREKATWEALKAGLENEKVDLQRRIDDLVSQNSILHSHLETVNAQANQIRQAAAEPSLPTDMVLDEPAPVTTEESTTTAERGAGGDESASTDVKPSSSASATAGGSSKGTEELHTVIKYLRREKEIVDLQMELNKQETARLKQSLEHVNKTLEETRTQLGEERARVAKATGSTDQHAELLEKINELRVTRETNTTLKDEHERSTKRLGLLESQLQAANTEIEPLKEQLRAAQVELEACQAQLSIVQEDNKRWQARAQSLLETHGLGEELKKVEAEKAEAAKRVSEAMAKVEEQEKLTESVRAELQVSRSNFEKLREQVKARISMERKNMMEWQEKAVSLQKEKEVENAKIAEATQAHEAALAALREERDKLAAEKAAIEEAAAATREEHQALLLKQQEAPEAAAAGAAGAGGSGAVFDQDAIDRAVEEAQKKWDEIKAVLEAEKQTAIEARDKHLQKGREFLRNQRAAEAQARAHEATIAQLQKDFADNNAEAIERAVAERLSQQGQSKDAGESADAEALLAPLRARIAELEEALQKSETKIRELETQLVSRPAADGAASSSTGTATSEEIEQLKKKHAEELKAQETALAEKFLAQQKKAVESSTSIAQGGPSEEEIELKVQTRLKALEDERELGHAQAIKAAVEAKERELKAAHEENAKSRFEAGKNEANLRNTLMLKQRDNKIAKLVAEIAELKGGNTPPPSGSVTTANPTVVTNVPAKPSPSPTVGTLHVPSSTSNGTPVTAVMGATVPAGPAAQAPSGSNRPSVFGRGGSNAASRGRGGGNAGGGSNLPTRPTPATSTTAPTVTSIRGAAATGSTPSNVRGRGGSVRGGLGRGGNMGRGGSTMSPTTSPQIQASLGAGAKRKLSTSGPLAAAGGAGAAAGGPPGNQAANAAAGQGPNKKPRPAGGPVPLKRPGNNNNAGGAGGAGSS